MFAVLVCPRHHQSMSEVLGVFGVFQVRRLYFRTSLEGFQKTMNYDLEPGTSSYKAFVLFAVLQHLVIRSCNVLLTH
jgi:hypothetical protein